MIGLIGAGNIARALARGLGGPILVTDSGSGRARALADELGGEAPASNAELVARADVIVLAHKPAQLEAVATGVDAAGKQVVSLLGAVTLERLRGAYPASTLTRAMPNTAIEIGAGVTCVAEGADLGARELFERVGTVVELPERLLDAATAVCGVAPAYVALLAEAWVDAAVGQGVPAAAAAELVVESLAGSAALLRARDMDTLGVRREVTSPGGMTARGLAALEAAGVRAAFARAAEAVRG